MVAAFALSACIMTRSPIDGTLVNREAMAWEEFIKKVEKRQDIEPLQDFCTYCVWGVTFSLLFFESVDPLYSILLILHLLGVILKGGGLSSHYLEDRNLLTRQHYI